MANKAAATTTFRHLLLRFPTSTPCDLPDLYEDDIWSALEVPLPEHEPPPSPPEPRPRPPRPPHRHVGGLSLTFEGSQLPPRAAGVHELAASAPVDVPNWQRFVRPEPEKPGEEEEEGELSGWMPPHEYAEARRVHGRSAAARSVLEGAGRTLKGRDISRVRNAVWQRTGFID